jgi:anti-sigma factor RsiW
MKPESLHALIIDRHFGELSPEAAELLELHLAENISARAEAERLLSTLSITRSALLAHPELARVAPAEVKSTPTAIKRVAWLPWIARAAAVLAFAAVAATGGYLAGRSGDSNRDVVIASVASASSPPKSSPWARYQVNFDPSRNGMTVVRVDRPISKTP